MNKNIAWILGVLLTVLLMPGCSGDDDQDASPSVQNGDVAASGDTAVSPPEVSAGGSEPAVPAEEVMDEGAGEDPDADILFAQVRPTGIKSSSRDAGLLGTRYYMSVDRIPGAVTYTFTLYGHTVKSIANQAEIVTKAPVPDRYGVTVFASNVNGVKTRSHTGVFDRP